MYTYIHTHTHTHTHAHTHTHTHTLEKIEEQWAQDHPQGSPQEKEAYLKWRRQSFIELQSIKNAIQWTASVLAGYTVAYPKSNAARMVTPFFIYLLYSFFSFFFLFCYSGDN